MPLNVSAIVVAVIYFVVFFFILGVVDKANNEPDVNNLVFLEGKVVDVNYPFYGLKYRPYYPY